MFKIVEENKVLNGCLKCFSEDTLFVGGTLKIVKNRKTGLEIPVNSFVNSMASLTDDLLLGMADGNLGLLKNKKDIEYLSLHTSNICTLNTFNGQILTGSWDHSATLLIPASQQDSNVSLGGKFYVKKVFPHPETVWKVLFVNNNTFITGCADKKIRIFKDNVLFKELGYHAHVVRSLLVDNDIIYSVDNYGKLLKFSMDGKLLKSRCLGEMCFGMCKYKDLILVSGENGSVFSVNDNLEVTYKTKLPSTTCWNVSASTGNIFVAGCNGVLYKLSLDSEDQPEDVKIEEEAVAAAPAPKKTTANKTFVSGGINYKVEDGKIYKQTETSWELFGDAENEYDHSFSVELDGKKYTLSFNKEDDVGKVATTFISKNKLDPVHYQEIVDYIKKNFLSMSVFKKYETIDLNGLARLLSDNPLITVLKRIADGEKYSLLASKENNIYDIERLLFYDSDLPLFALLDICKYLYYKKVYIDLSFLFTKTFEDKKEAKAFVFLMTNMIEDPPFDISLLHQKVKRLKDIGYLTVDDTVKYDTNYSIKNGMK